MADIYVDSDLNSASGSGTTGAPYGDLQYAINSVTIGASGDTFWIHGSEVLAATLTYTGTYGSPAFNKRMILRSWDGVNALTDGTCDISGAGTYSIMTAQNGIIFYGIELHNCGSAAIITGLSGYSSGLVNCTLHNTSGNGAAGGGSGNSASLRNCNLYDIGGIGASAIGRVINNYFGSGTKNFTTAINPSSNYPSEIRGNILSLTGSSNGIASYLQSNISNNSLLLTSRSGSPKGIEATANGIQVLNNVVEGFTTGFSLGSSTIDVFGGNHAYNNVTNYSSSPNVALNLGDNEDRSGGGSPFAQSGSDTFANRFVYFAPANVGSMLGGAI